MSEDQLVEVDGLKYIENILNLFDAFMNNIWWMTFCFCFLTLASTLEEQASSNRGNSEGKHMIRGEM